MVRVSGLEGILGYTHVGLGRVVIFCCDGRLVDNRFLETIAIHRALSSYSAVACFGRHDLFALLKDSSSYEISDSQSFAILTKGSVPS